MEIGEKFSFALSSTLNTDGSPDDGYYNQTSHETIADKYKFEYVMHGKIFRCNQIKNSGKLAVLASFGGLLMKLEGDPRNLHELKLDERIYLLIKRVF